MNILLVSNSDICRSRMAQKILSSFGHGTKIFTSGDHASNIAEWVEFAITGEYKGGNL